MNRIVATVVLAGVTFVAAQTADNAQVKTATQTKECTELAAQLQQKLNVALGQAEVDVEKAQKAALEFQNQMKGKSDAQVKEAMEAKRVMAQAQLQTAIQNLEKVSAEVQAQVKLASEQIQTRLQQKSAELKQIQETIQAKNGSGSSDDNGEGKADDKGKN